VRPVARKESHAVSVQHIEGMSHLVENGSHICRCDRRECSEEAKFRRMRVT
jgi:hypothetical protein